MSLTTEDVRKIAHLARIELKDAELDTLNTQLSRILEMVEQLNTVDTDTVSPMAHPLDLDQRLREDAVNATGEPRLQSELTEHVAAGVYLVPQIIDNP